MHRPLRAIGDNNIACHRKALFDEPLVCRISPTTDKLIPLCGRPSDSGVDLFKSLYNCVHDSAFPETANRSHGLAE